MSVAPRLYFDHNATSPLRPEAREALVTALDMKGNASSVHDEGRSARRLVEDAREKVAALVGARPSEVVFTSGASEANNWALGCGWSRVFHTPVEHESVLAAVHASGAHRSEIPVAASGEIELEEFEEKVFSSGDPKGAIATLQIANNETGVIQDVARAAELARGHGVAMHTDAVQACGRLTVDFAALDVDLMSVSSHKIGGPMGVGALVVRDGFALAPMLVGGGQERRRRAGTENVAAIAGFGAAAEIAAGEVTREAERLRRFRERLEQEILSIVPEAVLIGAGTRRLPNTTCVALVGERAETVLIKLDLAGVAVSSGSACSSGKVGRSHVLEAMKIDTDLAGSAIRISVGWDTDEMALEDFIRRFRRLFEQKRRAVA